MPDSYYPEPDDQSEASESHPDDETPKGKGDESPDTETALLPSSIFGHDVNPGDKCEFEVVGVHDGEIEVQYAKKDKGQDRHADMKSQMSKAWDGGGDDLGAE